jgi:hypothetical protein
VFLAIIANTSFVLSFGTVEVFQYIQSEVFVWDGVVMVLGKKLFDDARFEQCFLPTAQRVRFRFGLLEFSKQEA